MEREGITIILAAKVFLFLVEAQSFHTLNYPQVSSVVVPHKWLS
jgi:hypothetical protein